MIEISAGDFRLRRPDTPECRALLDTLRGQGGTGPASLEGPPFGPWAHLTIQQFLGLGLLRYEVISSGCAILKMEPMTRSWKPAFHALPPGERVRASRFGTLRVEDGVCVLETPRSDARITFELPEVAKLWALLAVPQTLPECAAAITALESEAIRQVLEALLSAALAGVVDKDRRLAEDSDEVLTLWSHHELLFHNRSRFGRHDLPCGAVFRLSDRIAEPPPIRPVFSGTAVPLARPGPDLLRSIQTPLIDALEQRHSQRVWDDERPIRADQLGWLLYLSSRICHPPEHGTQYTRVRKVAPEAGSLGALEVYILINHCADLARGAYYYAPLEHSLYQTGTAGAPAFDSLLDMAAAAMSSGTRPQVLLAIAARHSRVLWKYSSIGYALELKNVGVLFQTWYLLASAMGLGACAIGSGHADLLGKLSGARYEEESGVGEFALGSTRPTA